MKRFITFTLGLFLIISCSKQENTTLVSSPNGKNVVEFNLSKTGEPYYLVNHNNKTIIDTSFISFDFKNQGSLKDGFKIVTTNVTTTNETWEMPWGEQRFVKNNSNNLTIRLQEAKTPHRKLNIVFRVFDDGIGFRYEFPKQENISDLFITEENTEFNLTDNHKVWWIPGDWEIYEHLYKTTKFSEINAIKYRNHPNLAQTHIPNNAVNTPVTMRTKDGLHLSFHEAALINYSGMTLGVDTTNFKMKSILVGTENHPYKVSQKVPFKTPWRTIQIAEKAAELISSKLILNLNEPNKLKDVSWFTPTKYTGIWWEMHIGKTTWDIASGRHGATTENAKKYIDFSAKNNIGAVLVEGWNTGWSSNENGFDYVTPYPDYNLKEVVNYAKEKGIEIIMHHETFGDVAGYIKHQDSAYALMKSLGIHSVKSGYVFKLNPKGEYHHGQFMVNHYNNSVINAAKYHVAVNPHEPIKATGLRRTYPNAISREGLRGQEFNAWASDGGNPPEHLPIVAFTRMLAGPIDFTPGVFEIGLPTKENNQINTTIAQQLALYVVLYSPIQMACDLPENYENHPAFQFIKDVGVDWEQTLVLNGEVGDFVTIAREEKETGNWFIGGITDENSREITVNFDFLEEGKSYEAIIYKDGKTAHYKTNPTAIDIKKVTIKKGMASKFSLASGGGFAISLHVKH